MKPRQRSAAACSWGARFYRCSRELDGVCELAPWRLRGSCEPAPSGSIRCRVRAVVDELVAAVRWGNVAEVCSSLGGSFRASVRVGGAGAVCVPWGGQGGTPPASLDTRRGFAVSETERGQKAGFRREPRGGGPGVLCERVEVPGRCARSHRGWSRSTGAVVWPRGARSAELLTSCEGEAAPRAVRGGKGCPWGGGRFHCTREVGLGRFCDEPRRGSVSGRCGVVRGGSELSAGVRFDGGRWGTGRGCGWPDWVPGPAPAVCRLRRRRQCQSHRWRHALGRPRTMGLRAWKREVADELASLGWGSVGGELLRCGTMAAAWPCENCGDPVASVDVDTSCDVRCCPWCQRKLADERRDELFDEVTRVPDLVRAARARVTAEARAELEGHELDERRRVGAICEGKGGRRALRGQQRVAGAAKVLRRELAALRRTDWGWKLVTLSPPWRPWDVAEYSVRGLVRRLEAVTAAWRRVWKSGLSCHGLAAAYWRVELSAHGHVHLHALVFCPWWSQRDIARKAGMMADVRAIRAKDSGRETSVDEALRAAVREVAKYAVKAPTLRGDVVAGGDAKGWIQPKLAAHWTIATRHRQLVGRAGLMREAAEAREACTEAPETRPRACASCGCLIVSAPRVLSCAKVAGELVKRGAWRTQGERAGPVKLPPRVSTSAWRREAPSGVVM